jgi:hypothetical protein
MRPTIVTGDRVEIVRFPFSEVTPGQVIAFEHRGNVVTHRVVGRDAVGVITAGDAHWFVDAVVTEHAHLGLVAGVDPRPPARRWPARPRRVRRPPEPGAGIRIVPWIFTHDGAAHAPSAPVSPPGARMVPLRGVGRSPDLLAALRRELDAFDLVVLVHPDAVRPVDSLRELDRSWISSAAVLIGGRIGEVAPGTEDFIPSDVTDVQVRAGGIGEACGAAQALGLVHENLARPSAAGRR